MSSQTNAGSDSKDKAMINTLKSTSSRFALIILLAVSVGTPQLKSQNFSSSTSFQIKAGAGKSGQHQGPVFPLLCIEGCDFERQELRPSLNIELGVYRQLNKRHFIRGAIGYSETNYRERWSELLSSGFNRNYEFTYFNIQAGHKYAFLSKHRYSLYIENNIVMDILSDDEPALNLSSLGISYKGLLGASLNINEYSAFHLNYFYKTALSNYSNLSRVSSSPRNSDHVFSPFNHGVEIGYVFSFTK